MKNDNKGGIESFLSLCRELNMDCVLKREYYVAGETRGDKVVINDDGGLVDKRGDLFIALREVARWAFPDTDFEVYATIEEDDI